MSPPGQGKASPDRDLQAYQDLQLDGTAHSEQVLVQIPQNEFEVKFQCCLTPPLLPRMDNNQGQSRLPHTKLVGCAFLADCDPVTDPVVTHVRFCHQNTKPRYQCGDLVSS